MVKSSCHIQTSRLTNEYLRSEIEECVNIGSFTVLLFWVLNTCKVKTIVFKIVKILHMEYFK